MATTFPCPKCTQSITTGAAPGQKTRCKKCDERVRVPLRDAEPAPQVPCPHCGELKETRAKPGKRVTCRGCGESFRVPLPDADALDDAAAAEAEQRGAPVVRRTCPACGEKVSGQVAHCEACGANMDKAQFEARSYGETERESGRYPSRHLATTVTPKRQIATGFVMLLVFGALTLAGLQEGWLYFWPAGLTVVGAVSLLGGLVRLARS